MDVFMEVQAKNTDMANGAALTPVILSQRRLRIVLDEIEAVLVSDLAELSQLRRVAE